LYRCPRLWMGRWRNGNRRFGNRGRGSGCGNRLDRARLRHRPDRGRLGYGRDDWFDFRHGCRLGRFHHRRGWRLRGYHWFGRLYAQRCRSGSHRFSLGNRDNQRRRCRCCYGSRSRSGSGFWRDRWWWRRWFGCRFNVTVFLLDGFRGDVVHGAGVALHRVVHGAQLLEHFLVGDAASLR
jgi:hypothetical protein